MYRNYSSEEKLKIFEMQSEFMKARMDSSYTPKIVIGENLKNWGPRTEDEEKLHYQSRLSIRNAHCASKPSLTKKKRARAIKAMSVKLSLWQRFKRYIQGYHEGRGLGC